MTLQKIRVPGVVWFLGIGIAMYLAPFLIEMLWPSAPPSLGQLIVLIGGVILRTVDMSVRPDDREKLLEVIELQQLEIKTMKTAQELKQAASPRDTGPVMRGSNKHGYVAPSPEVEKIIEEYVISGVPDATTRWLWG